MDWLDAHLISNSIGPAARLKFSDMTKKYPIKMAIVTNIIEFFNRGNNHL